jgi:predicted nucleic acid-binding protein
MPGSFFDTNILLYIAAADPTKADRAEALLGQGGTISVQVLNEATHVARRKLGFSWPETHDFLTLIRGLVTVESVTLQTHETALALASRYQFSIYDALIAAAALHAGCDTLFSEDMQHNLLLRNRLRVRNPFRP